jgi:hypothetical protein
MKALRILLVLTLFVPTAFMVSSCEYRYRYACQDPANWNNEECQRPACEADGVCPDMLLGREITEGKIEAVEESNNDCCCNNNDNNNSEGEL